MSTVGDRSDLWSLVEPSLRRHGSRTAWRCRLAGGGCRCYRYRDIYAHTLDFADRLREYGVRAGDTVAILAPNGPQWGTAALAVWRVGARVAPVHPGTSDSEMASQIRALAPRVVLIHGVDRVLPNTLPIELARDSSRIDREREAGHALASPDDEAVRLYTSGSTGSPKMVRLSHDNIASNVFAALQCADFRRSDRFLSLLPLSHMMEITGGLLVPLRTGATIVLPRVLAATEILAAMAEERISVVIAVPRLFRNIMLGMEKKFRAAGGAMAVYRRVLKALPVFLRTRFNYPIRRRIGGAVHIWISGGSRLDPEITRFFHDLGLPLCQGYGLTETSPLVSVQPVFSTELDSVGNPAQRVEVRIHEPDAQGAGELWVKGPNVMLGYVDEAQTREVMEGDWFRTGDLARIDAQGNIVLTGRSKRLIVTEAGKNVYPEDLEIRLERFEEVTEAAVLEVEMRPAAVLVVDGRGREQTARDVLKRFNCDVSSFNQIARFALVEALPRTPVGKIALKELPAIFATHEIRR